jgi:hypothetical protein
LSLQSYIILIFIVDSRICFSPLFIRVFHPFEGCIELSDFLWTVEVSSFLRVAQLYAFSSHTLVICLSKIGFKGPRANLCCRTCFASVGQRGNLMSLRTVATTGKRSRSIAVCRRTGCQSSAFLVMLESGEHLKSLSKTYP